MRKLRTLLAAAALGSALIAAPMLVSGCAPTTATTGVVVTVSASTRPPAYYPSYYRVPRPRVGYVWVDGHWMRYGNRWVWNDGHWIARRPGYVWVQPRWVLRGNQYVFIRGTWRVARPYPTPYPYTY